MYLFDVIVTFRFKLYEIYSYMETPHYPINIKYLSSNKNKLKETKIFFQRENIYLEVSLHFIDDQ